MRELADYAVKNLYKIPFLFKNSDLSMRVRRKDDKHLESLIVRFVKYANDLDERWPYEEWFKLPEDEIVGKCQYFPAPCFGLWEDYNNWG